MNASRSDADILAFVEKKSHVLLTLDRDSWDDRRYPLHILRTGIIVIDEPSDEHDRILRAFGLVYGCFAKSYPLNWWRRIKARATAEHFDLKMRSWDGRVARYRIKVLGGRAMACELE